MSRNFVGSAVCAFLLLTLPLCASVGTGLPLNQVLSRWKLSAQTSPLADRVELSGRGIQVVLVPGLRQVLWGTQGISLVSPLGYRDGQLWIPPELLRRFPQPKTRSQVRRIHTDVTVILDPGHGGRDSGAVGAYGVREKDVNLRVALQARDYLKARGVRVLMTRTGDSFPSLQQRADLANRTPNCLFISIHANAVARDRSVRGIETFVLSSRISDSYRAVKAAARFGVRRETGEWLPRSGRKVHFRRLSREARTESASLAEALQTRLVARTGDEDRGVRSKNLHVLRESLFSPAVLVELGFLTHRASARNLSNRSYQEKLARGLTDGIVAHLQRFSGRQFAANWKSSGAKIVIR